MFARMIRNTILTLIVATSTLCIRGDESVSEDRSTATRDSIASIAKNNVRLRKLHLVRPDLIPYPLSLEVYC